MKDGVEMALNVETAFVGTQKTSVGQLTNLATRVVTKAIWQSVVTSTSVQSTICVAKEARVEPLESPVKVTKQ